MREIPLTKGRVALVDDEDYEWLSQYKWHYSQIGYAARTTQTGKVKSYVYMHRIVVGAHLGQQVDHVNGDKLDNRRSNLRNCTQQTNMRNRSKLRNGSTSQFKGVTFRAGNQSGQWLVRINTDAGRLTIGYYTTEIEAARAYDAAARHYHGEFARFNFPGEDA